MAYRDTQAQGRNLEFLQWGPPIVLKIALYKIYRNSFTRGAKPPLPHAGYGPAQALSGGHWVKKTTPLGCLLKCYFIFTYILLMEIKLVKEDFY